MAMPRKALIKAYSTRVLDYSGAMSQYERESLAAEAALKAGRKRKKTTGLVKLPTKS
jgi:hypothetical protein